MRSLIIALLAIGTVCLAQVPKTITIQVYLEQGGSPLSGKHDLTVTWYDRPVGGINRYTETVTVDAIDGIATLLAGSTNPIPDSLLLTGPLWLSFSIDGAPELLPRTVLSSVPYALLAQHAMVADALSPEVTGVVTSINEIAGGVEVVGTNGITISRNGNTLNIAQSAKAIRGRVDAVAGQYRYRVTTNSPFNNPTMICAVVHSDTFVGVTPMQVDATLGAFTLVTAAPLLDGEWIEWSIQD